MNLTPKQAFLATYFYLKAIFDKSKSDELAMVLSDMILLDDEMPADPAAWNDWLKSIAKVKQLNEEGPQLLTLKEAFMCMRYYVEQLFNFSYSDEIQNIFKLLNVADDGTPIDHLVSKNYLIAVHQAKEFSL